MPLNYATQSKPKLPAFKFFVSILTSFSDLGVTYGIFFPRRGVGLSKFDGILGFCLRHENCVFEFDWYHFQYFVVAWTFLIVVVWRNIDLCCFLVQKYMSSRTKLFGPQKKETLWFCWEWQWIIGYSWDWRFTPLNLMVSFSLLTSR